MYERTRSAEVVVAVLSVEICHQSGRPWETVRGVFFAAQTRSIWSDHTRSEMWRRRSRDGVIAAWGSIHVEFLW